MRSRPPYILFAFFLFPFFLSFLSFLFSFTFRQLPRSLPNETQPGFATCWNESQVGKRASEIWGVQIWGAKKLPIFNIIRQLRDLTANAFEMKRDNDNWKTTYCKRSPILSQNFVNFGPQTVKIGPSFLLSLNSALGFFEYHRTQVDQVLSGNKN